jgi:DNA-binding response OmpR family regulator
MRVRRVRGWMMTRKRGRTVVVAEDNFVTARLVIASLQQAGHAAVAARDGDEILRVIEKHRPGLIVLNMNLTRPSGSEVLRVLKSRGATTRVVAMTSAGQADLRIAALSLGADALVQTPFYPAELAEQVRRLLAA